MNIKQLEYALAVHRHRHFGKAAESCYITQATLSAMIKKMESELGIVLFDRSKYPIKTTEVGLHFIELAIVMLQQKEQMMLLGKQQNHELKGKFTLGVIPTIANSLLPKILPNILNQHPDLELIIKEITTDEIKVQLDQDKIDAGILATPLEDEKLEETILYYEAMMVYGMLDQDKKYVSSNDIKDGKIWLLEEGNCFRNQSITICDIHKKENLKSKLNFYANSFDTLLNLTDQFGGFTLIPEMYYKSLSEKRKLKTKHFEYPLPVREVSIVNYRPFSKKRSILKIAEIIKGMIPPILVTHKKAPKDLSIIGI